ncbi:calcineurin-like phosphoesterase family protein [Clostridium saccharoperbutylacetonicum]|uniref:Putative phosphoesterase or phosphohydrolase n=1 Tax=Clostridium saccharoperbutylacetonicum N1-4(HMT) TaxID=931276 RepID=M1MIH2_9CLOT|nr:metallophosphoesterase family protein [Clostridium saccharoperbutylacetonicum]AGF57714.1 putative phosphoesterase or phosphohydrolase [Clostridium saccharoperbutylacetonicum N1-4(HMT)]NRT61518.1 calcineurin-like phosphoesterase family protein [Clostridium saccharoperbutylacetonicum]NSB24840.1 calcineurin-like phosphoesterase family protein [Clostridium saccharoperbutylacetonicum]NSB44210.1 calcineurin-like phosphoesterase family protein [Clostridium saccharoperbutylacetonicum]
MIYFTSDLHFNHEKIIKHTNRPFHTVDQMNGRLIKNWNSIITPNDEVYILGDFTMKGGIIANHYLQLLCGTKYLIKGNHDNFIEDNAFNKDLFQWIKDYHEFEYRNYKFVLFHYPILEWNKKGHGSIHLHGHIHSDITYNLEMLKNKVKAYDVGVDANNYMPISIEEIIKTLG